MNYLLALTIFFVLYALILWRDLNWGLYILILLLPAYLIRFDIGPLPSTALEVMIALLVLRWLWEIKGKGWQERLRNLTLTDFFWPGLLLIAAAGLTLFWASDLRAALGIFKAYFIEPFLIYLILAETLKTKKQWRYVFTALGLTTIVFFLLALYQKATGNFLPTWEWTVPETRRATGPYTSPNALGLYVGPITALYIAWLFIEKKVSRNFQIFRVAVIAAGSLSILLALSRGAILALLVALFFILYKAWSKKWSLIGAAFLLLALLAIPIHRQSIIDLASFQLDSGQSRLALYEGSVELLKAHPFAGTGLAGFASAYEKVRPQGFSEELIYPHNIFLNFWTETGLIGLIAALWIMYAVYKSGRGKRFDWQHMFFAALLTMFVHGLVDVPYFKNDLAVLTWIMLAGVASARRFVL